ncbi:MAG: hypothetical protein QOG54_281 [Actinomycetota bacterium]|nr:hypothetical protein [Actinomycetota bacterium]
MGYEVDVESFPSRTGYQLAFAIYLSICLLGAALIPFAPLASAILGVIAFVLYGRDAEGRPVKQPSSPTSLNVVARVKDDRDPELVVIAHVDSARSGLLFHPRLVGSIRGSLIATHCVLIGVPILGMLSWYVGRRGLNVGFLIGLSVVISIYLIFLIGALIHSGRAAPIVSGANDNASGVEVLMRLAEDQRHGVWYAITGCEEAGMVGVQALLRAHEGRFGATRFLNIDSVGRGEVVAASAEGVLRRWESDDALLEAAVSAGAVAKPWRGFPTDATALLTRGRPALTLVALDQNGGISNWHQVTDTVENIDPTTLDRATEIARSIVDSILERQTSR